MSTSDDEFRDPTAPPPLSEDTGDGDAPANSPDPAPEAPSVDDTQVVDAGSTQSFTPPSGGYPPPSYGGPTYSTPSYEQPTYGSPYGQPPATPPAAAAPPGPGAPPPAPWDQPAGGYPSGPGAAGYPPPPTAGVPSPYPYSAAPAGPVGYGPGSPYVQPANNGSALALTIVSAISVAFCGGLLVIPALVFGIVGLTRQSSDPEGSRRASRNGWWAYAIGLAVSVLFVIAIVVFFVATGSDGGDYGTSYDGY